MLHNPYINAAFAALYIMGVVTGLTLIERFTPEGQSDIFLIPVAMLSLFVFSVALMALLFFYKPAVLLVDGQRTEALRFFIKTLGAFAGITAVLVATAVALTV